MSHVSPKSISLRSSRDTFVFTVTGALLNNTHDSLYFSVNFTCRTRLITVVKMWEGEKSMGGWKSKKIKKIWFFLMCV